MRLGSADGEWLKLDVVGREFPSATDHDANWLVIEGEARRRGERWRFREPSLLGSEVRALADWLSDVAAERHPRWPEISFIEPLFSFRLHDAGSRRLHILLGHEAAPPGSQPGDPAELDVNPTRRELEDAAADLGVAHGRFPMVGVGEVPTADMANDVLDDARGSLVLAVQWLAADSDAQLAAVAVPTFLADELAMRLASTASWTRELAAAAAAPVFGSDGELRLRALEGALQAVPTEEASGAWFASGLDRTEWQAVRDAARDLLRTIGEPRRDDLLRDPPVVRSDWD